MDNKARKEWDEILGRIPAKKDQKESKQGDIVYFDLKKLLKSIFCILMIIAFIVIFLMNYLPDKEILFGDIFGKYLSSAILYLIILVLFAKPVFLSILSFWDDDFGIILVPLCLILVLPFILIILFVYYIVSIIRNCMRSKL
jgi:hypothetical protein